MNNFMRKVVYLWVVQTNKGITVQRCVPYGQKELHIKQFLCQSNRGKGGFGTQHIGCIHAHQIKCWKRVCFWPSGINKIFRKRGAFQYNLDVYGCHFVISSTFRVTFSLVLVIQLSSYFVWSVTQFKISDSLKDLSI